MQWTYPMGSVIELEDSNPESGGWKGAGASPVGIGNSRRSVLTFWSVLYPKHLSRDRQT